MAVSKRIQRAQRASKLLGFAILGTLLLGLGSLYLPYTMLREATLQIQQRQAELTSAQEAINQLPTKQAQLQATRSELQFLEQGVTEAAYVPTLLRQFEQTAEQQKLEILAIRPHAQSDSQNTNQTDAQKAVAKAYQEQLFEIQLRGKFWSLVSLLKSLETFPKILAVESINLQTKTNADQLVVNPDLEITMTVKAFIFRKAQARPSENPSSSTGG